MQEKAVPLQERSVLLTSPFIEPRQRRFHVRLDHLASICAPIQRAAGFFDPQAVAGRPPKASLRRPRGAPVQGRGLTQSNRAAAAPRRRSWPA